MGADMTGPTIVVHQLHDIPQFTAKAVQHNRQDVRCGLRDRARRPAAGRVAGAPTSDVRSSLGSTPLIIECEWKALSHRAALKSTQRDIGPSIARPDSRSRETGVEIVSRLSMTPALLGGRQHAKAISPDPSITSRRRAGYGRASVRPRAGDVRRRRGAAPTRSPA